ncbi:uncharacterized protein F5147DRAFT_771380 [Suillus discolor]|uniref:DUF6830 domain-containing protein n=1 Tax=Suillus discolor TaxID=1912936 RepID=A0A9P7JWF4_9AGAM|nr:uncharacterized protein F5147DRAFT_771380 [Suillus discolor]KAG2112324.1 hypothetical protein F5147DRAFT_771380 [Suillus discolor]
MTGDAAWEMQTQFPRGATVLGTVLSSDKTNITTMTGARIAHPLLLGLTNICMCTHTKLSSKAFLLMALLPIPHYLHPNKCMRGVLEDRLIHQCLSIVLQPLMKAAEVGIMMSDPVGNVQHCFTPLAVYIVDTPEAAMLACVRGKTSLFTMASYLQFGDSFWHPSHTRSITLDQLDSITVDPNDLEAYFDTCAEYRLNEALHHWHKEFFDHDCQWCLTIVGASELDFQFSILQPITGYCHFAGGISKLKQVTGRDHHDIQCYIVGLISGAAPHRFIIAIRALMDVRYLVQSPTPNDDLLASIDRALSTFHEHKDIILTSELLQSITSGTCNVGTLIQWSADVTEHAHISEIKDPTRCTNNNDYDPQICRHLDRDEKLRRFAIAMMLKSHHVYCDPNDRPREVPEDEDKQEEEPIDPDEQEPDDPQTALLEQMNHTRVTMNYFSKARQIITVRDRAIPHPPQMFIAGGTAIHLNYTSSCTRVGVDDVATDFNIPDLRVVLSEFLLHDARERGAVHMVGGPRRRPLIDCPPILQFDRVQLWYTVRLQQMSFHNSRVTLPAQTVHASPPGPGWPKG